MASLQESLRRVTLTPNVVKISPLNPFGIWLDFDLDKWAEQYIKELEQAVPPHEKPQQLDLREPWEDYHAYGWNDCRDKILRFLRGNNNAEIARKATEYE